MNSNEIRELLSREPFQPFRINVTSGDSYEVRNPNLAVPMRTRLFIAEPNSDHWTLVAYLHISAVEALSNGHRSPRRRRRT
jgi:hypothetical protein